jgi:hypothetical protein
MYRRTQRRIIGSGSFTNFLILRLAAFVTVTPNCVILFEIGSPKEAL